MPTNITQKKQNPARNHRLVHRPRQQASRRNILEKESEEAKPRHDEPKTMYSHERLEHERRKAWSEGYAAGWKDQECDFPQYTSENPYKHLLRKQQGREAGR